MTFPALTSNQMFVLLNENDYHTVDDKDWETPGVERVMISNGGDAFPMRIKKFYPLSEVVKRCEALGITYSQIPSGLREEFETVFIKFPEFCSTT